MAPGINTEPLHWGAASLWRQLEPLLPGLSVEVVERTVSTNTALLERARVVNELEPDGAEVAVRRSIESAAFGRRAADVQPCLLVAEQQTGGRGRQGRAWHSAAGASLTFSLGLPLDMHDWSGLSLAVGVALCDALAPLGASGSGSGSGGAVGLPRLGLKWPNDLWLMDGPRSGRKLGGILIETVPAGAGRLAVIGIGLNVLPWNASDTHTGFASLQELDAGATAPRVLERIALPLVRALREFERSGFAAFAERFEVLDVLRGQTVRTTSPEAPEGVARGVSAAGALLVQTSAGMVSVASGEVSARLSPTLSAPG